MSDSAERTTRVHLELDQGYRVLADFGDDLPPLVMDEPPPLGRGTGPSASAVLGAAVADCLVASLLFCLKKAHVDAEGVTADVEVVMTRNERGRLRIGAIRAQLDPTLAPGGASRARRCLELFEDFCVVTESVREGINVEVAVSSIGSAPPDPV